MKKINIKQRNNKRTSVFSILSEKIENTKYNILHKIHEKSIIDMNKKLGELADSFNYNWEGPSVICDYIKIRKDGLMFIPEFDISKEEWGISINTFSSYIFGVDDIEEDELKKAKLFCIRANMIMTNY